MLMRLKACNKPLFHFVHPQRPHHGQVSAGGDHALILLRSGTAGSDAYGLGDNSYGQLGAGHNQAELPLDNWGERAGEFSSANDDGCLQNWGFKKNNS